MLATVTGAARGLSGHDLRRLLCLWVYALSFRREALSVLDVAFVAAECFPPRRHCAVEGSLLEELADLRVRHEYEYYDVCVNRSDDNMLDDHFQISQRLTSDLASTPKQCNKEMDNSANRADQHSTRHVRSWLQQCKMKSLP